MIKSEQFKKAGIPQSCPKCDGPLDTEKGVNHLCLACSKCGWRKYISYLETMELIDERKAEPEFMETFRPRTRKEKRFALLVQVVGEENAKSIVEKFAGKYIYIPTSYSRQISRRDIKILEASKHGMRPAELALEYGLSERQIFRILKRYKANGSHGT